MTEVRVATFNVENLFARFRFNAGIDPDDAVRNNWTSEDTAFDLADPEAKAITGAAIKATHADVICLQEVENLEALRRFRSDYLDGNARFPYALSIEGNDPRSIDVAVLSRHPIVHARSYAHLRAGRSSLFSRDCLEVDVLVDSKPLTLFVQHYKSMIRTRAETHDRRALQVRETMKIVESRFGTGPGQHPWVILGDFNDYLATDEEGSSAITALVEWDQVENVADRLPEEERWTHYYSKADKYSQLDYLLPSAALAQASDAQPEIMRKGMPLRAKAYAGPRLDGVGQNNPKASDHCALIFPLTV